MPSKPPAIHRAALDQHTECGVPLDKPNLRYQPSDARDPPTCRRCLSILTRHCGPCGKPTVRNRIPDRTPSNSVVNPRGTPVESLICACGHIGLGNMEEVGARQRQRDNRQRLNAARQHRERVAQERSQQRADAMAREQAEYPHPDTCALCDQPLPLPLSELYGYHRHYHGFAPSSIPFLPWYYCQEHRELGRQLDDTLIATFKGDALQILTQARQRVASPPSATNH